MINFQLGLVAYGFELNFPDGFVCRDFSDDYDDEHQLELAAMVAVVTYFEDNFEKDLDKVYKFLSDQSD